jgi:hypothetical protein
VARPLGITARGDGCAFEAPELTDATLRAWRDFQVRSQPLAPELACVALRDDLVRDSRVDCTPSPDDVFDRSVSRGERIEGEIAYIGIDPREYAYDHLSGSRGGHAIQIRVRLTGPLAQSAADVEAMQRKMDRAASFWTEHSPSERVRLDFRAVTTDASLPHFEVELVPGDPRVPYDVAWGREWSWHLLAHEIGHMMGLDDEYGQLRKTLGHALGEEARWKNDLALKTEWFQCNVESLMCDSKGEQSRPMRYHYYAILRRRFCAPRAFEFPRDF